MDQLSQWLPTPYLEISYLVLFILMGFLVHFILFRGLRILLKRTEIDHTLFRNAKKPALTVLTVIALIVGLGFIQLENSNLDHILLILLIITFSWTLINLVHSGGKLLLLQYDIESKNNLKARKIYTQIKVFERIVSVIILVVGLGLALMTFESIRHFGVSLLTSAGIAGIIIGLAAQRLIGNVLAGMQLALTQPIRIDDVVIVEGEWGWIEEITLTFVSIRIWDKRRLIVPSNYFIEKPFQNWTRQSADILGTVFLYTDYRFPVDELRKEVKKLLEETDLWDGNVNVTQVTNTSQNSMEIRVLVSAHDSPTAWDLRVFLRERLIGFIQKNYPQYLPRTRVELKDSMESKA